MKYRKLDADGDYTIGTGGDFLQNSPEVVAQAVKTRLALWLGEWFIDTTDGMPWNEQVLGKRNGRNPDASIRQRILTTPGVASIESYESTFDGDTRTLKVACTINTEYGQTTISEAL
ncbi:MAG: hypothetical protein ABFC42_09215 [Sulfuricella sp.]